MSLLHQLSLGDVLREHRRSRPRITAAVDGATRLTYPELDDRVNRLAGAMAAEGTAAGDRVLYFGQSSVRLLEGLLASAKLGAIFVPANWRQSGDELAFVVGDLSPKVVFWQQAEVGDVVADARAKAGGAARWVQNDSEEYETFLAGGGTDDPEVALDAADPVLGLYTAAFDGRPNAALLGHSALIGHSVALANARRIEPGFTFLNSGPLFHVGTLMFMLATFHHGGTNVFIPVFDAGEVARLVEAERVTHAFLFGPMIDGVVEANRDAGGKPKHDLSSLHFMAHSPEWDAQVTVCDSPWNRSKMGGYGQTEVGGMLTYLALGPGGDGAAGRPSPLVHVRIVASDGTEQPQGEAGEIVARGHHLFSGYLNRPELNAAKQAGGWHHTGDLGRREADGTITFIGPKLRMIKSANENIYPAEVERALKSHSSVADAAVIGVPDDTWGQGVKAIVALKGGSQATEEQIIEHVRGQVASYKKPRHVRFVEEIPKRGYTPDYDALDAEHGGGAYPGAG